jgi:hypothetical protein
VSQKTRVKNEKTKGEDKTKESKKGTKGKRNEKQNEEEQKAFGPRFFHRLAIEGKQVAGRAVQRCLPSRSSETGSFQSDSRPEPYL